MNKFTFTLYSEQVDIILRSLELYAYNLHYIVKRGDIQYENTNLLLQHTYSDLLSNYGNYCIGYNLLRNCKLENDRFYKKIFYKIKKCA